LIRHLPRLAAILALFAAATPALAQDGSEPALTRTPANAQSFLATYPAVAYLSGGKWYKIAARSSSPDVCKTSFQGYEGQWGGKNNDVLSPITETIHTHTLDWSSVIEVMPKENDTFYFVSIKEQNSLTPTLFRLTYASNTLGQRVLAAAQYLQTACDKTKDLGF
jgi:hypothetical protein